MMRTGGEDNDDDDGDAFGLESAARSRESKKSAESSEVWSELLSICNYPLTQC